MQRFNFAIQSIAMFAFEKSSFELLENNNKKTVERHKQKLATKDIVHFALHHIRTNLFYLQVCLTF